MKKYKYKIIFILNILIMAFLVGMSLFNEVGVKASTDNINIEFKDTAGGNEYFTYVDDNGETITSTGGDIPSDTAITLYANIDEDYRFVYWLYTVGETRMVLSAKTKVSVTVKKDYKFEAVYAKANECVVTYYDNTSKYVVDYKILNKGETAPDIDAPFLKGYSHDGWSKDLENITEDTDLSAVYNATVWSIFRDYSPDFFRGLGLTLVFSIISVFLALFLGAVLCFARISEFKPLKYISVAYIEVIRGVPLLLQLLLIYALMPRIDYGKFLNSEILAAILALFLNSGAYVAEIFRSGIQAVDKGQMEAGRALGLSKKQTMSKIIIPQAIKNVLPSIGNELIMVIKETSLASTVDAGIGELMSVKKQITSATFINIPPFIVIAAMYFAVTFTLSKVVRYIERRLESRD